MMKAPFRLRSGSGGLWTLDRDIARLAEELVPIDVAGLAVSIVGDMVALAPIDHELRLDRVAEHVRARLAPHGAPTGKAAGCFHMPLTAPLPEGRRDSLAHRIARDYDALKLFAPVRISDLALLWAPAGCVQMRVLERYPLTGEARCPFQPPAACPAYGPDVLTASRHRYAPLPTCRFRRRRDHAMRGAAHEAARSATSPDIGPRASRSGLVQDRLEWRVFWLPVAVP